MHQGSSLENATGNAANHTIDVCGVDVVEEVSKDIVLARDGLLQIGSRNTQYGGVREEGEERSARQAAHAQHKNELRPVQESQGSQDLNVRGLNGGKTEGSGGKRESGHDHAQYVGIVQPHETRRTGSLRMGATKGSPPDTTQLWRGTMNSTPGSSMPSSVNSRPVVDSYPYTA